MGFDLVAFKTSYTADKDAAVKAFWDTYDKEGWSLFKCTYDYPEDTETDDGAKDIVTSFMTNCGPVKNDIFGVMHVLANNETEGLFLFKGPDPEPLFGCNEDTSWFTWSQIGPDPSDAVKSMVEQVWNDVTEYNGKSIKHTQSLTS